MWEGFGCCEMWVKVTTGKIVGKERFMRCGKKSNEHDQTRCGKSSILSLEMWRQRVQPTFYE